MQYKGGSPEALPERAIADYRWRCITGIGVGESWT
jgi:hypothetical protein